MFHVELRQFPHNHARFNLSDGELVALVDPWVREQWVEMGERKWNCNLASMKIVEGPELPVQKLSMGRGWRTAQREGEDVTERVMAAAKAAMERAGQGPAGHGAPLALGGSTPAGAQASGRSALGPLDHVGYLVRDLDAAVAEWEERFNLEVVRPVELPQYSISGHYLGQGSGSVELFTITDERLLDERLGGHDIVLDHAAYEVADIDVVAAAMHERGVRFCGPDRREEVREPILLGGGVRHLWTMPQTTFGQSLQLLQRPSQG